MIELRRSTSDRIAGCDLFVGRIQMFAVFGYDEKKNWFLGSSDRIYPRRRSSLSTSLIEHSLLGAAETFSVDLFASN